LDKISSLLVVNDVANGGAVSSALSTVAGVVVVDDGGAVHASDV
jgi:hypothetical protein